MAEAPPSIPATPAPLPREPFFRRISSVVFVILSLGIIFVLYQIVAGVATVLLLGKLDQEGMVLWMRLATVLAQVLCIMVPTILLVRARYGEVVRPLRIAWPSARDIIVVAVALVALQQVLQGYMLAQDAIPLPQGIQRYVDLFKSMIEETYRMLVTAGSPAEFAGVVFTVAVVPAVVEELLFRGLVQRDLERVTSGMGAAIAAGVVFGLYHLNPFSLVPLVVLGAFFGFIVHRTQNITLAMTAHFLNNFMACCALYFGLGEDYVMLAPGQTPGAQMLVLNTAVSAVVFAGAVYYFVRSTAHE
jgi:membrane protease YdiL (CAAX protease family)